jgi:outer membrane protein assembly factor BamB
VTSDHSSVFAIDAATGHQMWTVDLQFMWMQSQPLIAGDHLYVGDQSGLIYALDIANGNPDWDYKLRPTTDFHGQLVVAGEVLYAAQTTGAEDDPYARVGYLSALFNPG